MTYFRDYLENGYKNVYQILSRCSAAISKGRDCFSDFLDVAFVSYSILKTPNDISGTLWKRLELDCGDFLQVAQGELAIVLRIFAAFYADAFSQNKFPNFVAKNTV